MASLRKAIDAKCKACLYDPCQEGTWRAQVQACTCTGCSLFTVRPLPIVKNTPKSAEKTPEITHTGSVPIDRVHLVENEDKPRLFSSKSAERGDT